MTETMKGLVAFIGYGGLVTIGVIIMLQVNGIYDKVKNQKTINAGYSIQTLFEVTPSATDESDKMDCYDVCSSAADGACAVAATSIYGTDYEPIPVVDFPVVQGYKIYCTTDVNFCNSLYIPL